MHPKKAALEKRLLKPQKKLPPQPGDMLSRNRSNRSLYGMPLNDQLFMVQAGVIRTVADQGPALFVGRCADYVLDGYKETIKIFLQASTEARIKTVMERENLSRRDAEARIKRLDKSRATYYNYYTDRKWSDLKNYDIVLNVSYLTPEEKQPICCAPSSVKSWKKREQ